MTVICSFGQNQTGYFVSDYTFNHNLNASFAPDHGYFGIPVLNGLNIGLYSNIGVSNFLYPQKDGSLALFLNNNVSSKEFLSKLKDINSFNLDLSMDLINFGWFTNRNSFWSVDIGLNVDAATSLPKELFGFLKNGMNADPTVYSIRNTTLSGNAYAYVSVGYSTDINIIEGLRVGGKVKFLASAAHFNVAIDKLNLELGSDAWNALSSGYGNAYLSGLTLVNDPATGNFSGLEFDPSRLGLAGMGAAFDLGAQYTLSLGTIFDGIRLSAAVSDLGFIKYNKDAAQKIELGGEMAFSGMENISLGSEDNGFSGAIDEVVNDLTSLVNMKAYPGGESEVSMITTKLRIGLDYSFLKNTMNVGLLYSANFGKFYDTHEMTLAWNYKPVHWFDVALSYSFMKTQSTFGALISLTPRKGLNFFIGSDYVALKWTPFFTPVNEAIANIYFGISVPFSGKHRR